MAYSFVSPQSKELFEIQATTWHEDNENLSAIRRKVFVEEQGVDAEEDWDGLDELESTLHFSVKKVHANISDERQSDSSKPALIATARVLSDGKIGRMCVDRQYRGHGIGKALLQEILHTLLEQQTHKEVYLNAQISAKAFYQTVKFAPVGETFQEAGIEHIRMELDLTDPAALPLIYEDRVIRLNTISQFQHHLLQLLKLGRHSLDILSYELTPQVFTSAIAEEVSRLARNHRQSQVRILLQETKNLVGVTHPLVELSQRLSTSVSIKKLNNGPIMGTEAYVVVDRNKLLYFNDEAAFEGFCRYSAAAECEHELQNFEHLWQTYGENDSNLNRLYI